MSLSGLKALPNSFLFVMMAGISPSSAWFHRASDDVRVLVAMQSVLSLSLLTAWGRIDFLRSSLGYYSFDVFTCMCI